MERFLLKEFAKTPTLQTGVFGSETAGNIQYSENPETIQSLNAWTEGLGSATSNATKQPAINDDQGIYKVLCKAIKNGQISGIPLYLETETYQIGSIVLNIENNEPVLYYSKTSNNIGNSLSDATNWVKYSDIFSDDYTKIDGSNAAFDNLSQTAKENIIDTSFGALQFSDMSKVGACFFQDLGNVGSATLPSGGTWFIYYSIRTTSGIIEQTYSYLTAGGTVLGSNERVISILAIRVQ